MNDILQGLTPLSTIAGILFIVGKMTGFGAAALVMMQMPAAKFLLIAYAVLIFGSIVCAAIEWNRQRKEKKNKPLSKEEVEALARQHGLI